MYDRREFLRRSAAISLAPLMVPIATRAQEAPAPRVRRRVTLGKTGIEVPDIGFGASALDGDVSLVRHALERGITHFDTAEDYRGGASEETLGRALEGVRNRVTITSTTLGRSHQRRADFAAALDRSLGRLRTDRIDIYLNHAVNDLDRVRNDEWYEFASRAKQAGKIRATGISGHGGLLVECLEAGIDEGLFDVVLVAHNFGQDPAFYERFTARLDFVARQPDLPRVLAKAREKGVGVIAMKTLRGAELNDLRPYEGADATFAQAAFRWVFSEGLADSLVVTMQSAEQVEEYLGASGWTQAHASDGALLVRHARKSADKQCRYGCGDCAGACPRGVVIPDLLRARMYIEDYGAPGIAADSLRRDGIALDACAGCDGSPCARACPHGVDISAGTLRLAELAR